MKNIFRACLIASLAVPCALFARRDEGLLVYMNFDDAKHPLTNVSGTDREASVFGVRSQAKLEAGKFVYSAVFSNANGNRAEPNNYAINLGELDGYYNSSFSVAFWFKKSSRGNAQAMITGNRDWLKQNNAGWAITTIVGKTFAVRVANQDINVGFPALVDGNWHHVALVIDRRTGTMTCYGDGKVVGTPMKIPAGTVGHGMETLVGASGSGAFAAPGDNKQKAYVDDYAIWTRALTAKEVVAMYNEGNGARVPEPSMFPLIFGAGVLAAALAVARRRRRATSR